VVSSVAFQALLAQEFIAVSGLVGFKFEVFGS
jgi:hypothetical protein